MKRRYKEGDLRRLTAEGVVILVSILLAFGIEAWWAGRQEQQQLAAQQDIARAQMVANRAYLQSEIEAAQRQQATLDTAIFVISPNPPPVDPDSLFAFLARVSALPDREIETSALEGLLESESFDAAAHPELYRHMVTYRTLAARLPRNIERFVAVKMRLTDYLLSVSPLSPRLFGGPDPGEAFDINASMLLSDPHLEGLLMELRQRHRIRANWSAELLALNDSILAELDAETR